MSRLTLGAARPDVAEGLGVCATDSKVVRRLNEAVDRLLPRGKWKGTFQRYRFCANQSCVTMPRHIETVEGFAVSNWPGTIRNEFFEFQTTSYGILTQDDLPGRMLINRGLAVAFDDLFGTTQKIKVYADSDEGTAAYILLQGYDENFNWIRTNFNGELIDGEKVLLNVAGPTFSVNYFTSLTGVQKPVTNGNVRLYSYDVPSGANVRALALYEPDETLPQYRRYMIPGLSQMPVCEKRTPCSTETTCDQKQVDLLVKMAFIPVVKDTDYLIIGNLSALKLACMSIEAEHNNDWGSAERLMEGSLINQHGRPERRGGAIPLLEEELANFNGDGPVATPRMQDPSIWGAGAIENYT